MRLVAERRPPHPARAIRPARRYGAIDGRHADPAVRGGASFADVPVHAEAGGGKGEGGKGEGGDLPRLAPPKMDAQAEPEFDEKPACLKAFTVFTLEPLFKRIDARMVGFEAPFSLMADFIGPCKCADLEYRQFIRGHITRDPDGENEDRGDLLSHLPIGYLSEVFQEDGDTSSTPPKYGYRSGPASTNPKVVDQYTNAKGDVDQANGCHYEMSDTPWAAFASRAGEVWDIRLDFYGEIRKKGTAIQRRYWTPIKGRFTAP
jgi:hypothetical protein